MYVVGVAEWSYLSHRLEKDKGFNILSGRR